ncbi:MAG: hypothetical protein AAGI38_20700 [Bacteroidota bacterium]
MKTVRTICFLFIGATFLLPGCNRDNITERTPEPIRLGGGEVRYQLIMSSLRTVYEGSNQWNDLILYCRFEANGEYELSIYYPQTYPLDPLGRRRGLYQMFETGDPDSYDVYFDSDLSWFPEGMLYCENNCYLFGNLQFFNSRLSQIQFFEYEGINTLNTFWDFQICDDPQGDLCE